MDALKKLKVGEKFELDESYGPKLPQVTKFRALYQWASTYMNETEGRPQFQFQFDREKQRYIAERLR